jgi:hypothetical protein
MACSFTRLETSRKDEVGKLDSRPGSAMIVPHRAQYVNYMLHGYLRNTSSRLYDRTYIPA